VHRELKRKHVTLVILWDEYIAANPGGYSYSRFCELYRPFEKTLSVTMRQTHAAGERLFVDYAGDGVPVVIDRLTGEIRMAQIVVAVLGPSSFTSPRRAERPARTNQTSSRFLPPVPKRSPRSPSQVLTRDGSNSSNRAFPAWLLQFQSLRHGR
jgi:transposase